MSKYTKEINALLKKIQNNDSNALKLLIDATSNHLEKVAYLYLKNKTKVQDVIVDVYERVWRYIDAFDAERDGYNWLCGIVKNTAYTYNRQESERFDRQEVEETVIDERADFDRLIEEIDLHGALEDLQKEECEILMRRFYYGESLREIGRAMGCSKTIVHKRLRNILKKIKKSYE